MATCNSIPARVSEGAWLNWFTPEWLAAMTAQAIADVGATYEGEPPETPAEFAGELAEEIRERLLEFTNARGNAGRYHLIGLPSTQRLEAGR